MARFQEGSANLRIEGVSTPTADTDAANKDYVDLADGTKVNISQIYTNADGGGGADINDRVPDRTYVDQHIAKATAGGTMGPASLLLDGVSANLAGNVTFTVLLGVLRGGYDQAEPNLNVGDTIRLSATPTVDRVVTAKRLQGGHAWNVEVTPIDPDDASPQTYIIQGHVTGTAFQSVNFTGGVTGAVIGTDLTVNVPDADAFPDYTGLTGRKVLSRLDADGTEAWTDDREGLSLIEVQTEIGESFAIDGSRFAFNGRGFEATIQGGPTTMTFGATTRTITGFAFTRNFDEGDILLFRVKVGPFKGQSYDHTVPAGGHMSTETEITHLNSLFRDTSDGAAIPTDGDVVVGDWYYADPEAWTLIATGDTLDDLTLTLNSGTSNFIVRRDPNGDLAPITTSNHTIQRTTTGNAELDLVSLDGDGNLLEGSIFLERGTGLITFEDALRGGQTFGDKADTDLNNVSSTISHFDQNAIVQKIGAGVVHTEIGAPLFNGQELGGDFNHLAVNGTTWTLNFTDPDEADAAQHFLNPLLNGIGPNRAAVNAELIETITRVGNSFNLVMENAITLPASTDDGAGFFVFSVDQERIRRIDGGTYLDGVLTIDDSTTTTVQELPPANPELGQGWVDLDTGQEYTFFGGAWTQTGGFRQDSGITGIVGQAVSDQQLIDIDTIPALTTEVEQNTAEIDTKQDTLTDYTPLVWDAKQDALTDYTPLVWDAKADLTLSNLTDTTTAEQDAIRANIGYAVPTEGFAPVSWDDIHGVPQTLGSLSDVNDGAVFTPGSADADLSLAFNGSNFETQAITSRAMRMEILVDGVDQPDGTLFTTGVLQDGSHVLIRFNDAATTRVDFIVSQVEDFRTRTPATFHITFLATTTLPIPASYVLGQFPTPFVTDILPLVRDVDADELLVRSSADGQWDAVAQGSLIPTEGTVPTSWDTVLAEGVDFQTVDPTYSTYATFTTVLTVGGNTVDTSDLQVIELDAFAASNFDTFIVGASIRFVGTEGDLLTGVITAVAETDAVLFRSNFTIRWDFGTRDTSVINANTPTRLATVVTPAVFEPLSTIETYHATSSFAEGVLRLSNTDNITQTENKSTVQQSVTLTGERSQTLVGAGSVVFDTYETSDTTVAAFTARGFSVGTLVRINTADGFEWQELLIIGIGSIVSRVVFVTRDAPVTTSNYYTSGFPEGDASIGLSTSSRNTAVAIADNTNFVGFFTEEDTTNNATVIKQFEHEEWTMRSEPDSYVVFSAAGNDVMSIDINGVLRVSGTVIENSTNLTPLLTVNP